MAINLVDKFPFEIISVDSVMVYKDCNIGSAKPNKDLLKKYKLSDKKVAVEHNGIIVPKINFKKKYLKNNDKIEIVHFIGGG